MGACVYTARRLIHFSGRAYEAGASIELDQEQAEQLVACGALELAGGEAPGAEVAVTISASMLARAGLEPQETAAFMAMMSAMAAGKSKAEAEAAGNAAFASASDLGGTGLIDEDGDEAEPVEDPEPPAAPSDDLGTVEAVAAQPAEAAAVDQVLADASPTAEAEPSARAAGDGSVEPAASGDAAPAPTESGTAEPAAGSSADVSPTPAPTHAGSSKRRRGR